MKRREYAYISIQNSLMGSGFESHSIHLNFFRIWIFMALTTEKLLVYVINLSKTQGNDT